MKKYNRKIHQMQFETYDCGLACISSILRYYGLVPNMNSIRKEVDFSGNGIGIKKMFRFFEKINANPIIYMKNKLKWKSNLNDFSKMKFPMIAHIKNSEDENHYIIIYSISKTDMVISDPNESRISKVKTEDILRKINYLLKIDLPKNVDNNFFLKKDHSKEFYKKLFSDNKVDIISVFAGTIIIVCVNIFIAQFFGMIIGIYSMEAGVTFLSIILVYFLIISLLKIIFEWMKTKLTIRISSNMEKNIYKYMLDKVFKSDNGNTKPGEIISRIQESSKLINLVSSTLITALVSFFTILFSSFLLVLFSVELYLIVLLSGLIIIAIILSSYKIIYRYNEKVVSSNSIFVNSTINGLNSFKTIKYSSGENNFLKKINRKLKKYIENSILLQLKMNDINFYIGLSYNLFLTIFFALGLILLRYSWITIPIFISFYSVLGYFYGSVLNLMNIINDIENFHISYQRLNSLIYFLDEEDLRKLLFIDKIESILFDNVTIVRDDCILFDKVSIDINNKEKEFYITGKSGIGKTSLVKLLVKEGGNYIGKIYINSIDIVNISANSIRKKVKYLSNSENLIEGSILENLCSDREVNRKELVSVLKDCCIYEKIMSFPDNLNTEIESSNIIFSLGELQRFSIAKAILSAPYLIIFDETFSNIDVTTKNMILENIEKYNIAKVFITHDMSSVKNERHIELKVRKGEI